VAAARPRIASRSAGAAAAAAAADMRRHASLSRCLLDHNAALMAVTLRSQEALKNRQVSVEGKSYEGASGDA